MLQINYDIIDVNVTNHLLFMISRMINEFLPSLMRFLELNIPTILLEGSLRNSLDTFIWEAFSRRYNFLALCQHSYVYILKVP